MDLPNEFIHASRRFLVEEYLPKIERCVNLLDYDAIWWQPNPHSNSVGTLIRHLQGNVRQYIVSGAGGEPDRRQRDEEFARRADVQPAELLEELRSTVSDVAATLERLDPHQLDAERTIQGRRMTVFEAIYHAVEHFSMHTGQIIYITKQLRDRDLEFYRFRDGAAESQW